MIRYTLARTLAIATLGTGLGAPAAPAGDLDPPAGPVAPTMKDLDDVEPRTALRNDFVTLTPIVINAPGSYYLAENIDAFFGQHGIEITADDVTLDLNGFRIRGNTEVGSLDGIHLAVGAVNVTIRNGTIEFFFGDGIDGSNQPGTRVETVRLIGNGGNGMIVGSRAVVRDCLVENSGGNGIQASFQSQVSGCTVEGSQGSWGLLANLHSVVRECVVHNNDAPGIGLSGSARLLNSVSTNNTDRGIQVGSDCLVDGCTAADNQGEGILVSGDNSTVTNCNVTNTNASIRISGDQNRIDSNHTATARILVEGDNNAVVRNILFIGGLGLIIEDLGSGNFIGPLNPNVGFVTPWSNLRTGP